MNRAQYWIFAIGFVAQFLFSARMIIQWFQSERAGKSLSPSIFWQLSLLGSIVFLIYGILRRDLAIIFGQSLVYYIYVRNLHFKRRWRLLPAGVRWLILLTPAAAILYLFSNSPGNIQEALFNPVIPLWLMLWGILGQVIFTLRFYVQWYDSELHQQSILSRRFWIVSMIGSSMIITYGILRLDPVLFLGHLGGLLVYIRNLMFASNLKK